MNEQILLFWIWFFGFFWNDDVKILPPLRPLTSGRAGLRPHHARTKEVFSALNKLDAPEYAEAIEFVRQTTGKGCSRRIISKWKKFQF